jgi:hypothetical protein
MDRASGAKRVENVICWNVAAAHLGLHLSQSWRISSVGSLQDNSTKAKICATHLRQLSSIQRSTNASPHSITHTRRAGVL